MPANAQLLVQFNRSVAALTVLQEGPAPPVLEFDPPIEGHGEWLNTSLYRFIPDDLQPSTTYSVRVPAGLTSAADGVLESDFTWSFTTIQPAIDRFEPGDGATHVEPDAPVVVTFNQPMDRSSVEAGLVLREAGGEGVPTASEWNDAGTVVTLTPNEPRALDTSYEVVAMAGLRGSGGGAMASERRSGFTTIGLPRIVRTYPQSGYTDAWPGNSISLDYNNPMDPDSFEGRVTVTGIDAGDIEVYWWDGNPEEVRLDLQLEFSTTYTVRIAAGVRDRGGRPAPAHELTFTTRRPYPSLSVAAPASFSTLTSNRAQVLYYHARPPRRGALPPLIASPTPKRRPSCDGGTSMVGTRQPASTSRSRRRAKRYASGRRRFSRICARPRACTPPSSAVTNRCRWGTTSLPWRAKTSTARGSS